MNELDMIALRIMAATLTVSTFILLILLIPQLLHSTKLLTKFTSKYLSKISTSTLYHMSLFVWFMVSIYAPTERIPPIPFL
jgi:hypothetical protein